MSEFVDPIEIRADGTRVFTHGHRYPDNNLRVVQEHAADGQLRSARIHWSGFAGDVMNLTVIFDEKGAVLKEEGYRALEDKTAVIDLIRPLPASTPAPTTVSPLATTPAVPPTRKEAVQDEGDDLDDLEEFS